MGGGGDLAIAKTFGLMSIISASNSADATHSADMGELEEGNNEAAGKFRQGSSGDYS